jgi:hypothetical protein
MAGEDLHHAFTSILALQKIQKTLPLINTDDTDLHGSKSSFSDFDAFESVSSVVRVFGLCKAVLYIKNPLQAAIHLGVSTRNLPQRLKPESY